VASLRGLGSVRENLGPHLNVSIPGKAIEQFRVDSLDSDSHTRRDSILSGVQFRKERNKVRNLVKATTLAVALLSVAALALPASAASAKKFKALLRGVNEVPPIATVASGELDATISADGKSITYALTYSNLEGITAGSDPHTTNRVLFAHFHFGPPRETGGVMVFLCNNKTPPPAPPIQACPDDGTGSGKVSGTLTSADVVGPDAQGIFHEGTGGAPDTADGAFAEVIKAIESGESYTNVHSLTFPTGEIRGKNRIGHEEGEE
jgi:CHRD domain